MREPAAPLPPPPRATDRSKPLIKSHWPEWGSSLVALLLFALTFVLLAASYLVDMRFMGPQPPDSIESMIYLRMAGVTAVLMVGFVLDAVHTRLPVLRWQTKWLSSRWMRRLILVGTAIALVVPVQRLGDAYLDKRSQDRAHASALEVTGVRVDELERFLHSLVPSNYQTEEGTGDRTVTANWGRVETAIQRAGGRSPEAEVGELHSMLVAKGAQLEGVGCDEISTSSPSRVVIRYERLNYSLDGYRINLDVSNERVVIGGHVEILGPVSPKDLLEKDKEDLVDKMAECLDFLLEN